MALIVLALLGILTTTLASMNMQVMAIIQKPDLIWDEFSTLAVKMQLIYCLLF